MLQSPWQHEARGAQIQYFLSHPSDDFGFNEDQWLLWRLKDAVLKGDRAGAAAARAEYLTLDGTRTEENGIPMRAPGYFLLIWYSLETGDYDCAADDLLHWFSLTDPNDVANNNTRRTNCLTVIDSSVMFLNSPGGRNHPQSAAIRQRCFALASEVSSVLTADNLAGLAGLSRG